MYVFYSYKSINQSIELFNPPPFPFKSWIHSINQFLLTKKKSRSRKRKRNPIYNLIPFFREAVRHVSSAQADGAEHPR